jgi:hypothetical protein
MKGAILIGDKTIAVNKIHFELPNFRDFSGMSVQQITERERRFFKNRLLLQDDKYEIVMDKRSEYDELYKKLEDLGGFLNVCSGYILKKNGSLTFSEYQKVREMLGQFLNFLNGNRTSILFAKGTADSTICWEDFSPNSVGLYKYVISWIPKFNLSKISDLYSEFSRLWKTDEQMLTIAIHWYIEANCNSAFVEGSITMIQNALELLYNWLIVEKLKIIKGEDSKNMSASNKIRILLSKINVESSIPKQLDKLIKTAEKKSDGPEIFTQIRNAIVHSQEEKRQRIYNLEPGIKFQALTLGIWYVELILLFILNYTGNYYNRCSLTPTQKGVEKVPWAK